MEEFEDEADPRRCHHCDPRCHRAGHLDRHQAQGRVNLWYLLGVYSGWRFFYLVTCSGDSVCAMRQHVWIMII